MKVCYLTLTCIFFFFGYLQEGTELLIPFYHNLPNTNAVLLCSSLLGIFSGNVKDNEAIGVGIGLVIYECLQLFITSRTFDVVDIIFTATGVLIFIGINRLLNALRGSADNLLGSKE